MLRAVSVGRNQWDDETLFHEARRMVIALYQKISTREYLATMLGEPLPPYTGYNSSVNPRTDMLFSFAVHPPPRRLRWRVMWF